MSRYCCPACSYEVGEEEEYKVIAHCRYSSNRRTDLYKCICDYTDCDLPGIFDHIKGNKRSKIERCEDGFAALPKSVRFNSHLTLLPYIERSERPNGVEYPLQPVEIKDNSTRLTVAKTPTKTQQDVETEQEAHRSTPAKTPTKTQQDVETNQEAHRSTPAKTPAKTGSRRRSRAELEDGPDAEDANAIELVTPAHSSKRRQLSKASGKASRKSQVDTPPPQVKSTGKIKAACATCKQRKRKCNHTTNAQGSASSTMVADGPSFSGSPSLPIPDQNQLATGQGNRLINPQSDPSPQSDPNPLSDPFVDGPAASLNQSGFADLQQNRFQLPFRPGHSSQHQLQYTAGYYNPPSSYGFVGQNMMPFDQIDQIDQRMYDQQQMSPQANFQGSRNAFSYPQSNYMLPPNSLATSFYTNNGLPLSTRSNSMLPESSLIGGTPGSSAHGYTWGPSTTHAPNSSTEGFTWENIPRQIPNYFAGPHSTTGFPLLSTGPEAQSSLSAYTTGPVSGSYSGLGHLHSANYASPLTEQDDIGLDSTITGQALSGGGLAVAGDKSGDPAYGFSSSPKEVQAPVASGASQPDSQPFQSTESEPEDLNAQLRDFESFFGVQGIQGWNDADLDFSSFLNRTEE